jgi:hypothetical protein
MPGIAETTFRERPQKSYCMTELDIACGDQTTTRVVLISNHNVDTAKQPNY